MRRTRNRWSLMAGLALGGILLCSCTQQAGSRRGSEVTKGLPKMNIEQKPFGKTPDGKPVDLFTLTNPNGMRVDITNYGGIVVRLMVPDRNGNLDDVVLGYDKLEDYIKDSPYFGAIVGRYGNRIAKGRFTLDGVEYKLAVNNGPNHLHGGLKGFDKVVWQAEPFQKLHEGAHFIDDEVGVKLTCLSKDGEEGYPGNLKVTVWYALTYNGVLKIRYEAETDKPTPVNLTHHGYWNLAGAGNGDILGHRLTIRADDFIPVDAGLIPTGEVRPVKGTPMDFTADVSGPDAKTIGARIDQDDEQLRYGKGYDHCWVLGCCNGGVMVAATVLEPTTGRVMEVSTTEPGIQFYSGNFLDGSNVGKGGKVYEHRYGFCLETQHFPDSPNKPQFPSTILQPGQKYQSETWYRFAVER
jgi:aldose 1-epimerase